MPSVLFASHLIYIFDPENTVAPSPQARHDFRRDRALLRSHTDGHGAIFNPRGVARSQWHQLIIVMDFGTERQYLVEKVRRATKKGLEIRRKREHMLQWCCENNIVVVQPQWIRASVERGKMFGKRERWGGWRVELQFETPEEREAREAAERREEENKRAGKEQEQQHEDGDHDPPSSPLSALSSMPPTPRTTGGGRPAQTRGQRLLRSRSTVAESDHVPQDNDKSSGEQEEEIGEGDASPGPLSKSSEQGTSEEGGGGSAQATATKRRPTKGRRQPAKGQSERWAEQELVPPEQLLPTPVSQSQSQSQSSSDSGQSLAPRKRKLHQSSPPPASQPDHARPHDLHAPSPGPSRPRHHGALPSPESPHSGRRGGQLLPAPTCERSRETPPLVPLVEIKEESGAESSEGFSVRNLRECDIDLESHIFCHANEPLTFGVMPQAGKRPIELMIRENGGVLVDTDKALFVIVPVNPPVRPRGLHPKASVVYADWIWDSVRAGERKEYECYESRMAPTAMKEEAA